MPGKTLRTLVAIGALSVPLLAQTQTRPSFAGKWERVPEKGTQSVTPPGFPPVPPLTISQDATTITVSKLVFRPPATVNGQPSGETQQWAYSLTYTCDGKEHPESAPVPPLPAGVTASPGTDPKYIAAWRGDQLVITTRATGRMGTDLVTQVTYSVDKEGLLVVETVRTMGNQPTPASRSVYRKVS